jgi:hypothetical protein
MIVIYFCIGVAIVVLAYLLAPRNNKDDDE